MYDCSRRLRSLRRAAPETGNDAAGVAGIVAKSSAGVAAVEAGAGAGAFGATTGETASTEITTEGELAVVCVPAAGFGNPAAVAPTKAPAAAAPPSTSLTA